MRFIRIKSLFLDFILLFISSLIFFPKISKVSGLGWFAFPPFLLTVEDILEEKRFVYISSSGDIIPAYVNDSISKRILGSLNYFFDLHDLVILIVVVSIITFGFNLYKNGTNFSSKNKIFKVIIYVLIWLTIMIVSSIPYFLFPRLGNGFTID